MPSPPPPLVVRHLQLLLPGQVPRRHILQLWGGLVVSHAMGGGGPGLAPWQVGLFYHRLMDVLPPVIIIKNFLEGGGGTLLYIYIIHSSFHHRIYY